KAEVARTEIHITAASGEANDSGVTLTDAGDLEFFDNRVKATAGAGCSVVGGDAVCPLTGITQIVVALGDKNDSLSIEATLPPLSFSGGTGTDEVIYAGDVKGGATVTLDGVANDGRGVALDNIAADVEVVDGTFESDTLIAGATGVLLNGSDGDDTLTGGAGNDNIKAAYVEDTGLDLGAFSTQGKDTISCGGGNDQVFADAKDKIASDCEVIGKPAGGDRYAYMGSAGNDTITVGEFVNATVHGLGGNDSISLPGQGNGSLYGDAGNDKLKGSQGFDKFSGGPGNDSINARDKTVDSISCGTGRDSVKADKKDKVARDCEKVSRK
ncbi:MAG: hypothetical protein QOJ07_2825, partial [Thermoleophilaceae bacterium]|nr:hypothetical protein [Thermoleophilaceae bacterium]